MDKEEASKCREYADLLWEMAKIAKSQGFYELEEMLILMSDTLHAKSAGIGKKSDSTF